MLGLLNLNFVRFDGLFQVSVRFLRGSTNSVRHRCIEILLHLKLSEG